MSGAVAPRRPLTQERVVTTALRLVDRRGLEALSMRRLGTALGVEAMSLYKHVPNKAVLLDLLVERVLADVAPPAPGARWEARVRHVAHELRRVACAHPHVFPLLATRVPATPRGMAPLEALLAALGDAGLDDDALLASFWTLLAWATGALLAETAAQTGFGAPAIEVPAALDPAAFPSLARLGKRVAACDFGGEYERGLAILIAAVRNARAARSTPAPAPRRRPRGRAVPAKR